MGRITVPSALLSVDLTTLTADQLVAHVAATSERRAIHAEEAEAHRQNMVDAIREGRSRTPPVLQRRLAEAAGITEGGVIAALRKDDKRKGETATG